MNETVTMDFVGKAAQAVEARLRDVVTSAGTSRTRVAETPFNIVLEAKAAEPT